MSDMVNDEVEQAFREGLKMTISNPCYHCYMGAIGECLRCPISYKLWSKDLEHETIEIDDDIDDERSEDYASVL